MSQTFDLSKVLAIPELPKYMDQIEGCMRDVLSAKQSKLADTVLRLTKARGKRLRPALVIASALLSDKGISESAIQAAAAIELIHIGSLVHDDIIDKASTRWGIPTINAQEGLDYAILSGDFMFAKACALASGVSQEAGVVAAETIALLCEGQSAELAVQYNLSRTEAQAERAIHGKTAALMAAACKLGGVCTGQPENKLKTLSNFGDDFGMSFQLVDDVLDFISTDALMGKPVGNDVKEGVYTMPVILSLKGPKRTFIEKELVKKQSSHEALTELLLENGSIDKTLKRASEHNHSAAQALDAVFHKRAQNLAQLPHNYLDWALSSMVALKYKNKISI